MKTLSLILFPLMLCFGINERIESQTKDGKDIPVINKKKSYPEKTFEPEVETIYVPLETSGDILLGYDAHIYYISDKRMLIVNGSHGDVFIFDMNGKAISHFNAKGPLAYRLIEYAAYDEKNKEIFILGIRKIFVFSEDGILKRTLRVSSNIYLSEIQNFDNDLLLVFHKHQYGPLKQTKPYMFLSKKDGSIISRLNVTMNKANPRILKTSKGTSFAIGNNYSGNCKFGQEFILANMSSDTIYLLNQDKILTPLFVQYPTVFSDPPLITSVRMKTNDYIAFSVYPFDLKKAQRDAANGKRLTVDIKNLIYEFKTCRFFELKKLKYTVEKTDVQKDIISVARMSALRLTKKFKKGELEGKLKEIAAKLKEDDNPVVEIIKLK